MSSRGSLLSILTVGALALIGVVGFGLWPRLTKQRTMLASAQEESDRIPTVRIATVGYTTGAAEIELPADLQAEIETPVYARVEGYIVKRLVDIGWHVKKGQLLAELETPELDQQILQAKAAISQGLAAVKQQEAQLLQEQSKPPFRPGISRSLEKVDRGRRHLPSGTRTRRLRRMKCNRPKSSPPRPTSPPPRKTSPLPKPISTASVRPSPSPN